MIGPKIKSLRKSLKLTQDGLAEKAGIAREQISRYETGRITPDTETIAKIASALNVSISELLDNEELIEPATVPEEVIRYALSNGKEPITKAQYAEIQQFVRFIQERDANNENR